MPAIVKGKKQQLTDDLATAKRIKPRLRKFVIDAQVQQAAKSAKEQAQQKKDLLADDDVLVRAEQLAKIAYFDLRLWKQYPPYFEMQWLTKGWATPDLAKEMQADVAGFAYALVLEYRENYLTQHKTAKRGYLNPMQEANLLFFWQKWNADLRLLIETDRRRMALGNAGVVLVDGKGKR